MSRRREYRQRVDAFEVASVAGGADPFVSVYVETGERCDVNIYLPVNVARALAKRLIKAADVAEKG